MGKPSLLLLACAALAAFAIQRLAPAPDSRLVASPEIRTGPLAYPRQAVDSDSYRVTIAKPARRIVSQSWSIDEYLYSVVPPERVVAVSQTAFLPGISNVYPQVRRYHPVVSTDPERVLRQDPDLMLVANTSRQDFCAIVRATDIPIYRTFVSPTDLNQVAETIRLTGYLTGEDQAARAEIGRFWSSVNRARARRPAGSPSPRILGYGGHSTYGSGTLFDAVIRTIGGVNVGAEGGLNGYAPVNSEQIVRWNPEWIVTECGHGEEKLVLARLLADPGIALTQAARSGHVVIVEHHVFLPMSPFTALLVTALADAVYGH